MNDRNTAIQREFASPLNAEAIPSSFWSCKVTIRHGHCDPAGIVYTPKFFDLFNQAIEGWFIESLGIDYYHVIGERRTGLGYVTASAEFFAPCVMGDELEIFVRVARVGTKSYTLMLHAMRDGREALRGHFTTVTTTLDDHKSIAIPADIKAAIVAYSGKMVSVDAPR